MAQSFRLRRGTAAQWTAANPVLAQGEPGYETDTGNLKIGDGATAWASLPLTNTASLGTGYVSRTTRTAHAPALGLYFPEAEGAVGDGVAVDTAAFQAAIDAATAAGGGRVVTSYRASGYLVDALTVKPKVTLVGENGVALKKSGTAGNWITMQDDTTVEGLTLDRNGTATNNVVYTSSARVRVERNTIIGTGGNGVRLADGATDVTVSRNVFDGALSSVHGGSANLTRIRIENNRFTNWTQRAVYVAGSATHRVSDFRIEGNHISGCIGSVADPRQPIGIQGSDSFLHRRVRVVGNTIVGRATSYDDPDVPGTADQISLHRCEGFVVADNLLTDGGEVGITVSQQCKNGSVTGNTIVRHDSVGICIGSAESTSTTGVTVTGNSCMDNGMDRPYTGKVGPAPIRTRAGILTNFAVNCTISGNECGDAQGTPTQLYAVVVQNSNKVTVGPNGFDGTYPHYIEALDNTNIRWSVPPLVAVKTVDETVNNTATVQNDDALVVNVERYATYRMECFVRYNSSTTADLKIGFSSPAGVSMSWTTDGPTAATTSVNTNVGRISLNEASQDTIGGTGASNAIALLQGLVTVGATEGALQLRWAQGTAEVSDTKVLAGSHLTLTRIG